MTKDQAIKKAVDFGQQNGLQLGPIADVVYLDLNYLDEKSKNCPPDLMETYQSVRKKFRNHWVISFKKPWTAGEVICPETVMICLYEDGTISLS